MVEGEDLSFHTIPMKLPNQKPKTGKTFANYWMHNSFFVDVDNEKMSKILGSFVTVHDASNDLMVKCFVSS